MSSSALERTLRNDRMIVLGAVIAVSGLALIYTLAGVGMNMSALEMTRMARPIGQPMTMAAVAVWTPSYAVLMFLMWWIMMIAMMTPSAAPTLLLYAALKRQSPRDGHRAIPLSWVFLTGYLIAWAAFSAIATMMQWSLSTAGILQPGMMTLEGQWLAGIMLILAGIYQFTPLKQACLSYCRSPAEFLSRHNRPGARGALVMGLHHGTYCLGCCWALMVLLFVGGIMNLYWIVGLAAFVAIEKLSPWRGFSKVAGIGLIIWGAWVVIG